MRPLEHSISEAAINTVVPFNKPLCGQAVMEYPQGGGNKEGQQQQQQQPPHLLHQELHQQQHRPGAYLLPQEARQQQQPQHRLLVPGATTQPSRQLQQTWPPQQTQQQIYAPQRQQQQQSFNQRVAYPTQQDIMATAPVMDHLPTAGDYQQVVEHAQQQQQYLSHQMTVAGAAVSQPPSAYATAYNPRSYQQLTAYQQQLAMQQQSIIAAAAAASSAAAGVSAQPSLLHQHHPMDQQQQLPPLQQQPLVQQPYLQQKVGRAPLERPLVKLSVSLIDTYKHINTVYYEERDARRAARAKEKAQKGQGANNNGWDDENYDYIVTNGELFYGRYHIKERIGKGSFGQVVRAEDIQGRRDVAIKIIKSKKPFLMQAKTEIELLTHLNDKDPDDQHNIVRLITHFMYRNHQCLVFEMLSLNLYELLKNTQFGGISLTLIRKFAKQVLKSLLFLARTDVDIIHCDLKPENILLRHPKKSGVKVIDFGSSCQSNKRMYSYIQSRFYRSPEVMLGLPYSVSIDMWSLGCILAEMHTGEPLFSGSDQFDQMQKIVKLLGMVPVHMLDQSSDQHRLQFFDRQRNHTSGRHEWVIKQQQTVGSARSGSAATQQSQQQYQQKPQAKQLIVPSRDPIASLTEVIRAETHRKKKYPPSETGNTPRNYDLFVDLIYRMLSYDPQERIKPVDALNHPFITTGEQHQQPPPQSSPPAFTTHRR